MELRAPTSFHRCSRVLCESVPRQCRRIVHKFQRILPAQTNAKHSKHPDPSSEASKPAFLLWARTNVRGGTLCYGCEFGCLQGHAKTFLAPRCGLPTPARGWILGRLWGASSTYSPPQVDRIRLWVDYNTIPPYSVYLRGTVFLVPLSPAEDHPGEASQTSFRS